MSAQQHAGNRANEPCDSSEDLAIPRMQESKMRNLETEQQDRHGKRKPHEENKPLVGLKNNGLLVSRSLGLDAFCKSPLNPVCHGDYSRAAVLSDSPGDLFSRRPSGNCAVDFQPRWVECGFL